MWGDKFQIVVATHLNTKYIHNHFLINSVSFIDGKKYYDNHSSYAELRRISDNLCREHGLSVIENKKTKAGINYGNYEKQNNIKMNYYKLAKMNLDIAISQAKDFKEFIHIMNNMNYEVIFRSGKISIRDRDYKRNIRIERFFGIDYSIQNIKKQIQGLYISESRYKFKPQIKINKKILANKSFIAKYMKYLHLLNLYPKYVKKNKVSREMKKDILKMNDLSLQAIILSNNNIETDEQFHFCLEEKQKKLQELISKHEKDKNNELLFEIKNLRKELRVLQKIEARKESINEEFKIIEREGDNYECIK